MRHVVTSRRFSRMLALVALATYGSAGIFGYGLHSVWHVRHGDASETHARQSGGGCHCCHGHDAAVVPDDDGDGPSRDAAAQSLAAGCDECPICSFLAQAQSSAVETPEPEGVGPCCMAGVGEEPPHLAGAHRAPSARGPPRS